MEVVFMEKDLCKIYKQFQKNKKENEEFRLFLKGYEHYKVDEIVHELFHKYTSEYDCIQCAKCCKELAPTLSNEEKERIAEYLDISKEKFNRDYIARRTP